MTVLWLVLLASLVLWLAYQRASLATAIAARTKQMRVGPDIAILPLYDPVRVAEDGAHPLGHRRRLGEQDVPRAGRALHPRGHVDRVAPNIIGKFLGTDHACNHRPRVYAYSRFKIWEIGTIFRRSPLP